MLTPLVPHTPQKHGTTDEYHAHIYLDTERQAYIQKGTTFTDETRTVVKDGHIVVPVRVYELVDGKKLFWKKAENQELFRVSFPEWLPYDSLTSGVEGSSFEITICPRNEHQSLSYKLLCNQKSVSPDATFESTLQAITQSIAKPHFENAGAIIKSRPSLKPLIEEAEKEGFTKFKIQVIEGGYAHYFEINPEILKKFSPFFRNAIGSEKVTVIKGDSVYLTLHLVAASLVSELVYYLKNEKLNSDISVGVCLGLVGLNATLGNDEQNMQLEQKCLAHIKEKMDGRHVLKVISSARSYRHQGLANIAEEYLVKQNLNLATLGNYNLEDLRDLKEVFPNLAALVAKGFQDELTKLGF